MLKQFVRFLRLQAEASAFEGYYRRLLNADGLGAPTADEARRDYRQALTHNWPR